MPVFDYRAAKQHYSDEEIASFLDEQNKSGANLYIPKSDYILNQQETRQQPSSIFKTASDLSEKGLGVLSRTFVDPTARALIRPAVSLTRGIQGLIPGGKTGVEPMRTPFGEVKPFGEVRPGEAALEAIDIATFVPGAAVKLGKAAISPVTKLISKVPVERVASFLTSVPKEKFFIAQKAGKESFQKALEFVDRPEALPEIGETIFKAAKALETSASEAWKKSQGRILTTVAPKLQQALTSARSAVKDELIEEGIQLKKGILNLADTAFSQNPEAQKTFNRIISIINEPSQRVEALLNKRSALTDVIENIPLAEKNIRRVASKIVNTFDDVLNEVSAGQINKLRSDYKKIVAPAREFIDLVTDNRGRFSHDKASLFIKQTMSDIKFDKRNLLLKIDNVAKTNFSILAQELGAARALSQLAPATSGRIKDVILSYGITKIPVVSALVSPRFWSNVLVKSKGAVESGKQVSNYLMSIFLQNLFEKPIIAPFREQDK